MSNNSRLWRAILEKLATPTVTELEVNGFDKIFIKESGQRKAIGADFGSPEDYAQSISDDLVPLIEGFREYDPKGFLYEGPLEYTSADGTFVKGRCHIVLPPASYAPQITVAKKSVSLTSLESIQMSGSLSPEMADFIRTAVKSRCNIIFSGSTGSGKALHKDTLIPTLDGIKPMSEVEVGDTIFTATGSRTKVVKKYCPHDEKCVRLTFDNGEQVKTSGGHLWEVWDGDVAKVVTSSDFAKLSQEHAYIKSLSNQVHFPFHVIQENKLQLAKLVDYLGVVENTGGITLSGGKATLAKAKVLAASLGYMVGEISEGRFTFTPSEILPLQDNDKLRVLRENLTDDVVTRVKNHKIHLSSFEVIDDNPEDYFCVAVDDPRHLFLCTESFIPTHNTTMMEAVTKLIPSNVRIGVAEDTPELQLEQPNVTYLHSVPWAPGMDANNEAPLRWCIAQFNRMRVDSILVGETRGKEFFDFLTAANSGVEGCMTTLHANSPTQCIAKMKAFALKGSPESSTFTIAQEIANAVDIIIQLEILANGKYRTTAIQEVTNTVTKDGNITSNVLYQYDPNTDSHSRKNLMTDLLRTKFRKAGHDPQRFIDAVYGKPKPEEQAPEDFFNKPSRSI